MLILQATCGFPKEMPWRWVAVSGVLLAIHWVAFFHAIQVSTVAVGLLTFSSFPLFVTLLEPWFFRERRRWLDLFTAVLVMAGLAMIVPSFDFGNNITQGILGNRLGIRLRPPLHSEPAAGRDPIGLGADGRTKLRGELRLAAAGAMAGRVPSLRELLLLAILGVVCTAWPIFCSSKASRMCGLSWPAW